MAEPKITIIVGCHQMPRELPRTLRSLSPQMQRGVDKIPYEVIIVDNGSTLPFCEKECRRWFPDLRVIVLPAGSYSPVRGINVAIEQSAGEIIGVMIDGGRLVSPGILSMALHASRLSDRVIILTLGFHLGPKLQFESIFEGYNQEFEDRLLTESRWIEDGYRLFDISVLAASSSGGWFRPMNESNAIFMRREMWNELGGLDERFKARGGGLVNLDLLCRASGLPNSLIVTLLGEATFHQFHGGVSTNAFDKSIDEEFRAEYEAILGHRFRTPEYHSTYFGCLPPSTRHVLQKSVALATSERSGRG